jgi:hypothetical protein
MMKVLAYLDITCLPWSKTLLVAADISHILLANIAVPAIGISLRRVLCLHFLVIWEVEKLLGLVTSIMSHLSRVNID